MYKSSDTNPKVYQVTSSEECVPRRTTPASSSRRWTQTFITFSICYICISAGNLVGYTSSAIPSIREGNTSPFFPKSDQPAHTESIEDSDIKLSPPKFGFLVQADLGLNHPNNTSSSSSPSQLPTTNKNESGETCEFVHLTDNQASWIGGLAPLGAFVGCIIATIPIQFVGPKGTIFFTSGPAFLISWMLMAFAPTLQWIYISRFIGGLAMGLTFSAVPIYIVECASVELRGPLGTLPQFIFTVGVLVSFICGSCLDWRMTALTSAFMVLPAFIFLPFIPESPLWLMSKNRLTDAESAFKRIHGISQGTVQFQRVKEQQMSYDINRNAETNTANDVRGSQSQVTRLFQSPSARKSAVVSIFLCVFQQLTGINGVNFYTVTIFKAAAGTNSILDEHSCAVIVASVFCFANLCSYVLIEKLGRKFLLVLSTVLISLAAFSLGLYFYILESGHNTQVLIFMPLASLITFVLAFSIGYGPLLYVIVAEISPSDIRSLISPVAVGINWLCVFLVAKTFPALISELGAYGTFWLYGSFSLVSLVFTLLYVPETKGKSEDEIKRYFSSRFQKNRKELEVPLKTETELMLHKLSVGVGNDPDAA